MLNKYTFLNFLIKAFSGKLVWLALITMYLSNSRWLSGKF